MSDQNSTTTKQSLAEATQRGWDHASAIIDAMPTPNVPADLILKDLDARLIRLQEQRTAALTDRTKSLDFAVFNGFNRRVNEWSATQTDDALWPTEVDRVAAMEAQAKIHAWPQS